MNTTDKSPVQRSRTFTLLKAIGTNSDITEVTVTPLTVEQATELKMPQPDKITIEDEEKLVVISTGLKAQDLQLMTKMDFNTISTAAYEYLTMTSYELAGETIDVKSKQLTLYFQDDEPTLDFEYPTLLVSKAAAKCKTDAARAMFVISQITDLDEQDVKGMAMPDYLSAVELATGFLTLPADFFQ